MEIVPFINEIKLGNLIAKTNVFFSPSFFLKVWYIFVSFIHFSIKMWKGLENERAVWRERQRGLFVEGASPAGRKAL